MLINTIMSKFVRFYLQKPHKNNTSYVAFKKGLKTLREFLQLYTHMFICVLRKHVTLLEKAICV